MTADAPPAVRLEGITKTFGDVVANDGVDFRLEPGTIHALLGENGSGKTTLMSVLYGLYDQDSGTIYVDGEPRTFDSPQDAMEAGIGMIHQHFQLVEPMTALQNVVLGHEPVDGGLVDEGAARREIERLCDRYGFAVDRHLDTPVEELDLGTRQRVEIVKSLYRGAEIVIFDEPTDVLTPQEVDGLLALLDDLRAAGHSLIFISHKLDEVLAAADRITVLRDGKAIDTVPAAATSERELAEMMVGRAVSFDRLTREATPGEPVLEAEGISVANDRGRERISGVDLTVREREILGIAGVQGNGQTELIEALTGHRRVEAGTVRFRGDEITETGRRRRLEAGIAYIPEDRRTEGLVQEYDLVKNALLGNQTVPPYATAGWIDWSRVADHAEEIVREFDVQPPNPAAAAASLSAGNQQKFIVGREIGHEPDAMLAAHPTRGVDVGSLEFIHERLIELRDEGLAIVLVSSKLDELCALADRIVVMYEGRFIDEVDPTAATDTELGLLMAGQRLEAGAEEADAGGTKADARGANAGTAKGDEAEAGETAVDRGPEGDAGS